MDPYNEGYKAKSVLDNPYWLNYPNEADDDEKIKARRWVDGWVQQIIDKIH